MTTSTVNLVVKVPAMLRKQARAAAVMRGETISDVVRHTLAQYIEQVEKEDDLRYADAVVSYPTAKAGGFRSDGSPELTRPSHRNASCDGATLRAK